MATNRRHLRKGMFETSAECFNLRGLRETTIVIFALLTSDNKRKGVSYNCYP